MTDQVVCRSEGQYPERPVALYHEGQRLTIAQILARWRTPEGRCFRVLAGESMVFDLIYNEGEDRWVIESR